MAPRPLTRFALLAAVAAVAAAPAAMADTLVQTDTVGPVTLFTGADVGSVAVPITISFDQFDPMLGNLVSVQFQADFAFNGTLNLGPAATGGSISVGGTYLLNGVPTGTLSAGGGNGNGGAPGSSVSFGWNTTPPIDVTLNPIDHPAEFATFIGTGPIEMTYDAGFLISADTGTTADAELTSASYTLTYTYDVPEPGSLALLGFTGLALLRRRRA